MPRLNYELLKKAYIVSWPKKVCLTKAKRSCWVNTVFSTAFHFMLGDLVAQTIIEKDVRTFCGLVEGWDPDRLIKFGLLGGLVGGPLYCLWSEITRSSPSMAKILFANFFYLPIGYTLLIAGYVSFNDWHYHHSHSGHGHHGERSDDLIEILHRIMISSFMFIPGYQMCKYYNLIPNKRILRAAGVGYIAYLSMALNEGPYGRRHHHHGKIPRSPKGRSRTYDRPKKRRGDDEND